MKKIIGIMLYLFILSALFADGSSDQTANSLDFSQFDWINADAETASSFLNTTNINAHDENGFTYLVYASAYSKPEVVSAFLASGADINQQSMNGWTPLAIAIQYDNRDVYHELIEMDAQVFYSQSIHDATPSITPLAVAVNKKNSDATELLLTTWLGNGTSNFEYLNEDNIQNINLELLPIGVSVKFKESISIADFTTNITNALKETDALTNP